MNRNNDVSDTTYVEQVPDCQGISADYEPKGKWLSAGISKYANRLDDSERAIKRIRDRYKPLDPEEEKRLAKLASTGDRTATDELVRHFMRLISKYASQYAENRVGREYADLVQQGALGVLSAIQKYDCARGRLATYVRLYIRNSILKYVYSYGASISAPEHVHHTLVRIAEAFGLLMFQLGRPPTDRELSACTGLPEQKIQETRSYGRIIQIGSLDSLMEENQDDMVLSDMLASPATSEPDCLAEKSELETFGARLLNALTPREKAVLRGRFGFAMNKEMTFEEVGNSLGVSRQRVQQIEHAALHKLRTLITKTAKDYLEESPEVRSLSNLFDAVESSQRGDEHNSSALI